MKDSEKIIYNMGQENKYFKKITMVREINMKEISKKISFMEMVCIFIQTVKSTKGTGKKENKQDLEYLNIQMGKVIKDNLKIVKNTAKEYIQIQKES